MTTWNYDNLQLLVCTCGDVSHQLIVRKLCPGEVSVEVHLSPLPFWRRLINGIKYIFGHRSKYGDFEEVILNRNHAAAMLDISDVLRTIDNDKTTI